MTPDPEDDGVPPLSRLASGGIVKPPTAVKVADLQDRSNSQWNYAPEHYSAPIHISVERRKVDKVLEIMEGAAGQLRALDGIDVAFAVHADHHGRVEGEMTIREPYKPRGVR